MVKGMGIRVDVPSSRGVETEGSCWASIPPELLRDILKRVEVSEESWPQRKSVVACAGVCSTWREVTRDLVRGPESTGKLTFPVSLKQVLGLCFFLEHTEGVMQAFRTPANMYSAGTRFSFTCKWCVFHV